jgi:8-oxo-dGTP pyrophosphatase MutT (NUDIX family)
VAEYSTLPEDRDLEGAYDTRTGTFAWSGYPDPAFAVGHLRPAVAVAVLALRCFPHGEPELILQWRHPGNATTSLDRYSHIAGRVSRCDLAFAEKSPLGNPPWEQAFRNAAGREAYEEAGLDLDTNTLVPIDSFATEIESAWADCRVFLADLDLAALAGDPDAVDDWLRERDLTPMSGPQIVALAATGKANTILRRRLYQTFLPLLSQDRP